MRYSGNAYRIGVNFFESEAQKVVTCSIYFSFEEVAEFEQEWDTFVEAVEGDIYLSYTWCRTWWDCYGSGRKLLIYIYRSGDAIVGLLPVFFEKQWLGPVWSKIAKIVGSDFTIVMINPPVEGEFAKLIFEDVIDSLLNKERCDALWIGPTGGQYKELQQLREAIYGQSEAIVLKDSVYSPYTTFLLPDTFDGFIQALNKRQRGNLRRDLNLIGKSFEMTQDVIQDEAIASAEFEKFVQMHTEQWETEGKLGHFNDWPKGVEFHSRLVNGQVRKGRLRLLRLLVEGKVVSYQLCYAFGKRWYWRLPARVVGPDWDKYALGRIGLIKEIEMAIIEGVKEIEAGPGHYDYKIKLGGTEYPLYTFLLTRTQRSCRWRAFLFLKLSSVLHFFYYRVWFNRLAPKLPFKRKPLWKLWIRTRL
ncbi:GNAT family N-acetyltransferase [Candidatus Roizmanbacteria bacterium]|nr:GNAT family N-acetyltransferase [Candidatus Roizmanbacteria bacterium]